MSGFAPDLRARSHAALRDATIDVLIIGGGINGAGLARDFGLRRQQAGISLQVALVEQKHFASGASGKNSQLIHGGLRYLKQLKIGLVKEALRERAIVRGLAPHMVEPLPTLIPIYNRLDKIKHFLGLRIYDQLAGEQNIARHREVSRGEVAQLEPMIAQNGLVCGALFYDCTVNSARFVLENLYDAAANGVFIANYTRANPVNRQEDGSWLVRLEDAVTGDTFETKAKKVIDATGAWSQSSEHELRLVRGSHLILPRLTAEDHAVAFFDDNGRIVFFLPWGSHKQLTLLGTTDVDHKEGPDDVRISKEEVEYLLGIAQKLYPSAPSFTPLGAFSSLRPLVPGGGADPTTASREHKIWNTKDNILRITGGKYTTYRAMSEEAADLVLKEIAPWFSSQKRTATEPLAGNTEKALSRLRLEIPNIAAQNQVARSEVESLVHEYGVHTTDLLTMLPPEDQPPITRIEYARMAYAVQHEMALRLADVFFVSTYFGYERKWEAAQLEPYARLMGSWIGWDQAKEAREIMNALQTTALPAGVL
jgi:glycerol-3-phosphate dehydrogenase